MLGLMMDRPLLISQLIEHAAEYHGDKEIVSRSVEGSIPFPTAAAKACVDMLSDRTTMATGVMTRHPPGDEQRFHSGRRGGGMRWSR